MDAVLIKMNSQRRLSKEEREKALIGSVIRSTPANQDNDDIHELFCIGIDQKSSNQHKKNASYGQDDDMETT